MCLLTFNTFMTIFGAVGTPVWFGIGEAGFVRELATWVRDTGCGLGGDVCQHICLETLFRMVHANVDETNEVSGHIPHGALG